MVKDMFDYRHKFGWNVVNSYDFWCKIGFISLGGILLISRISSGGILFISNISLDRILLIGNN